MTEISDQSFLHLLHQCILGEESAWKEFHFRYHPLVSGIGRRFCPDPSSEGDVAQTIYIRLWEKDRALLRKFEGHSEFFFKAYLAEVSKNIARSLSRTQGRIQSRTREVLEGEEWEDERSSVPQIVEEKDFYSQALEAIKTRDPKEQTAFRLRMEGYRIREISEILGIPESSAGQLVQNLKIFLQKEIFFQKNA